MSADNWAVCPKCAETRRVALEDAKKTLEKSYGKIPVDAYLQLREQTEKQLTELPPESLREDYSIGIYCGEFSVNYTGRCQSCQYEYRYSFEDKTPQSTKP